MYEDQYYLMTWFDNLSDRESVANSNAIEGQVSASRSINLDKSARGTINDRRNDFLGPNRPDLATKYVKWYETPLIHAHNGNQPPFMILKLLPNNLRLLDLLNINLVRKAPRLI